MDNNIGHALGLLWIRAGFALMARSIIDNAEQANGG